MQLRSKNCLKRVILSLLSTILLGSAYSQTIRGKVFDTRTGEPMSGATVMIEHTHYVNVVQLDGSFSFKNIPAGKYVIAVSTVGYQPSKEIEVDLSSGKNVTDLHIGMAPSAVAMEEVLITTGLTGGDNGARRLEQKSDIVQNILSARAIELSPDVTAGNAM